MPRPLTFRDFALRLQLFILPSSTVRSILRSPRGRKRIKMVDDIMTGTYAQMKRRAEDREEWRWDVMRDLP